MDRFLNLTWMAPKLSCSRAIFRLSKMDVNSFEIEKVVTKRPFRVSIEGNIASGKSTLINYFKKFAFVEAHSEPLGKWRDVQGHNLLGLLYEDISRWNATFQSYAQLTRIQTQSAEAKSGVKVQMFERSVQNNCFMENSFRSGYLSPPEYAVLRKWYEWIQENIDISLDLIGKLSLWIFALNFLQQYLRYAFNFSVYLKTEPEVVFERVKSRNRKEELTVSLEYLQDLHNAHEKWLTDPNLATPVLTVNANCSMIEAVASYQNILPTLFKNQFQHSQVIFNFEAIFI